MWIIGSVNPMAPPGKLHKGIYANHFRLWMVIGEYIDLGEFYRALIKRSASEHIPN
jgi:hypothetical protein